MNKCADSNLKVESVSVRTMLPGLEKLGWAPVRAAGINAVLKMPGDSAWGGTGTAPSVVRSLRDSKDARLFY